MNNELLNNLKNLIDINLTSKWMTMKDVCNYSSLSYATIFRAIQKGTLKVSKKTGKNLFRKEWVDKYLGI